MSGGRMTEDAVADTCRPASLLPPRAAETREVAEQPVIEARGLCKHYWRGARWSSGRDRVTALAGVDFAIRRGQTIALVGESGSGKTTLARCLALVEHPDAGEIRFEGRNVSALRRGELADVRRRIQLVFQHSALAMNPQLSAEEIVSEPLQIRGGIPHQQRRQTAMNWMDQVGLPQQWAGRRPSQLSGGQRQRLAIARAMILNPDLVIFDEALAGLDSATSAGIVDLLLGLQSRSATSYIFITHDLEMAKDLSKRILVMENGRITDQALLPKPPVISARQSSRTAHS
jgi:ABC-type glutathione transport system ATPase component